MNLDSCDLNSDIMIYDGAIPLSSGVTDFTLAFDSSTTSDSYSTYEHIHGVSTSVPEPGSMALFSIGLAAMGFVRRRKTA